MTNKRAQKVNVTNDYVCFHSGLFSNWYPCDIIYDGWRFKSSEHIYMYLKALYFNDLKSAHDIKYVDTPKEAKQIGRQVAGFDQSKWDTVKFEMMYKAVKSKFEQNKTLQSYLLSDAYKDKHFVEGSPYDTIWGVGIDWRDEKISNKSNWKGQNLLGQVLDKVRKSIKQESLSTLLV